MQKIMTVVDGYVIYFIYLCNMVAQGKIMFNTIRID